MTLGIFFIIMTMTDPHPCLRIWDYFTFVSENQFKHNWIRLMTFHQNFNSLLSLKDPR